MLGSGARCHPPLSVGDPLTRSRVRLFRPRAFRTRGPATGPATGPAAPGRPPAPIAGSHPVWLRLIRDLVWPRRGLIAHAVVWMLVMAAATVAVAHLLQPAVDGIVVGTGTGTLWALGGGILAAFAVKAGANCLARILVARAGLLAISDARMRLYHHLAAMDPGFFQSRSIPALAGRFTVDLYQLKVAVSNGLTSLGRDLASLVGLVGYTVWLDWRMAMLAYLVLPVAVWPVLRLGRRIRRIAAGTQTDLGRLNARLTQTLRGLRMVKIQGAESFERARVHDLIARVRRLTFRAERTRALVSPIMELVIGVAAGVALYAGGSRVLAGAVSPGEMTAFLGALLLAYQPAKRLANLHATIQDGLAAADRMYRLLDTPPPLVDAPDARPLVLSRGAVRLDEVWVTYADPAAEDDEGAKDEGAEDEGGAKAEAQATTLPPLAPAADLLALAGSPPDPASPAGWGAVGVAGPAGPGRRRPAALRGLTLDLVPGGVTALVGPSGAGKSTVVNLLARFFDPDQGRVLIDGQDLRRVTRASLWQAIALVAQEVVIFDDTLAANIAYGRPGASMAEIEAAAQAAAALPFIQALPQGFATHLGEAGLRLSGGQRQRLAIARALLKNAPVLLLDEPTAALDPRTEAEIQAALKTLMVGRTCLVVAHRLSTIAGADRIAVLDQGRVVACGTHHSLLAEGGLYARLAAADRKGASRD